MVIIYNGLQYKGKRLKAVFLFIVPKIVYNNSGGICLSSSFSILPSFLYFSSALAPASNAFTSM